MPPLRSLLVWPLLGALALAAAFAAGPSPAHAAPGGPSPYAGGTPAAAGAYDFVAGIRALGAPRGEFFCTGTLVVLPSPLAPFSCPIRVGTAVGWGRTPATGDATSHRLIRSSATTHNQGFKKTFWTTKTGGCPGDSGGWLDWLVGGQCSRRGTDYYSDVSGGPLLSWFERFLP